MEFLSEGGHCIQKNTAFQSAIATPSGGGWKRHNLRKRGKKMKGLIKVVICDTDVRFSCSPEELEHTRVEGNF